jgi:hypothetical protein
LLHCPVCDDLGGQPGICRMPIPLCGTALPDLNMIRTPSPTTSRTVEFFAIAVATSTRASLTESFIIPAGSNERLHNRGELEGGRLCAISGGRGERPRDPALSDARTRLTGAGVLDDRRSEATPSKRSRIRPSCAAAEA